MPPRLPQLLRHPLPRRAIRHSRRNLTTEEQIKTAELQKTPHTPNQIATEVPHSKEASLVYDVPSPLWFHRLGPVKDFFSWFSRMQRRRPLSVAVGTSLTTYFCGDIIAQEISGDPYDWKRTARMLLIGSVASVPGYKWFLYLGSHFNYGSAVGSIAIKVAIQQVVFAPVFNSYFFGMQALLSGETVHGVVQRLRAAVPESILSSAKFWPAVTALNFTLIPAHLRFAFSGVFAVVWQTYLSFLNRKKEEKHMEDVTVGWTGLAEDAKDRAGERLDEAGITDLVDDVKEKVADVVEDVKDKVTDVVEDVKEKAEDAKDKVSGLVEDVKEKVADVVEDVKDKAEEAKDKVSDLADDAKDKLSDMLGIGEDEDDTKESEEETGSDGKEEKEGDNTSSSDRRS